MKLLAVFLVYALALSFALSRRGVRASRAAAKVSAEARVKRILVLGATGGTGRQLVAQALEQGYEVTALARNPSKMENAHPRLRVVRGDVLDYPSVEAAVRGQEAVLSALGHKRFFYPNRILSDGTRNVCRAMETCGVRRFVCESALGLGDSAGRMGLLYTFFIVPVVLPFYFWDKTRQERVVAKSSLDWVIVRPGVLTNGAKRGAYRHGRSAGSFLWTVRISRADVADFMLRQTTENGYLRASPGVCN